MGRLFSLQYKISATTFRCFSRAFCASWCVSTSRLMWSASLQRRYLRTWASQGRVVCMHCVCVYVYGRLLTIRCGHAAFTPHFAEYLMYAPFMIIASKDQCKTHPSCDMCPAPSLGSKGASWPFSYLTHTRPVSLESGLSYLHATTSPSCLALQVVMASWAEQGKANVACLSFVETVKTVGYLLDTNDCS